MKIWVFGIAKGHILSLSSSDTGKISYADIFVFYIIPIIFGWGASLAKISVNPGFFGISISVFSVFSALLLSAQIAIFGIYSRSWEPKNNRKENEFQTKNRNSRNLLIKEVNYNISYLILLSIISLFVFSAMYLFTACGSVAIFTSSAIYVHFSLTMIMVIKRTHSLFSREYEV